MTFKVGDRVRQVGDAYWRGMEGVYHGRRQMWDYFIPDAGSKYFDGAPCTSAGKACGMQIGSFELIPPTSSTATERLERLEAFVARVANAPGSAVAGVFREEARCLVAELTAADPDLEIAREMESKAAEANGFTEYAHRVRKGEEDDEGPVRCRYEGIKRGRALEKGEVA